MPDRQHALAQAIEHHMAGRFDQAERGYLKLHKINPDDEEVLYLLGVLACDVGIPASAMRFLDRALELSPQFSEARHQLGVAFLQSGERAAALAQFDIVLEHAPERTATQLAGAETLLDMERIDEAVARIELALSYEERNADAWRLLARAHFKRRDPEAAAKACLAALDVDNDHAETLGLLGLARLQQRRFDEALAPLQRASSLAPDSNPVRNNLAMALRRLGRLPEAKTLLEAALAQDPAYIEARANLADVLRMLGDRQAARPHFEKVIAAAPRMVAALNNFAALLQDLGEHDQALALLDRAAALAPDSPQVRWNRALSRLTLGDYTQGWEDFEARWEGCENLRGAYSKPLERAWRGEPLAGKRLLLWAEQGFGDTLQFVRFVPQLLERGAIVLLEAQRELVPLLRTIPHISVFARGEPLPAYDVHCPLMSLPHRLQLTLDTLPSSASYLAADAERVAHWSERLAQYAHPRVGLVWAGRARHGAVDLSAIDARRSVTLDALAPILRVAGVQFFSLQKDRDEKELAGKNIVDLSDEWRDFADTAAFIANLDLVISVDTAVAHLAGALGKPVWLLNRYDSCWRWLRERDDSPWYPTLRQFRQPEPSNWAAPIADAAHALEAQVRDNANVA